jgi:DNA polymerase I-like protein with 3'-5' exonuclease and polymerase domains
MTQLAVIDLETYYSRDFSLSKISTEAYVRSSQFEPIGLSLKINDAPGVWYPKPEVNDLLRDTDWSDTFIIAQNTAFDGAILNWRYGVNPKAWMDTLGMSRALYPHEKSHSLAAQATRHGIGQKGNEVINALGKHYADFGTHDLDMYAQYCINDGELTYKLFNLYMGMGFPRQELQLIDLTLRMFIEPALVLDKALLETHLSEVKARKLTLLEDVRDMLLKDADPDFVFTVFSEGTEGIKKLLMSNDKFAEVLRRFHVEPPMKKSPLTGKEAYAFAKTDEGFTALAEHENFDVQGLVAARLGTKTTIEESRTERFIEMADRGAFPVPLRYYGAATGRWSGQDKVNLQNLPSRGKNAGRIKKSMLAPPGYVVIDCDSAQIEARVLAWLAGQDDLVAAFERKEDVYKLMATYIYNVPIEEVTKAQRTVGKTVVLGCFGPETEVLTCRGWVPIISVRGMDMLWDGESWVHHQGLVAQGEKEVLTKYGVSATLDHGILTGHGWREWYEVCENPRHFQSALSLGSSPSSNGGAVKATKVGPSDGNRCVGVPVGGKALHTVKTWWRGGLPAAIPVLKRRLMLSGIGNMRPYVEMWRFVFDCLTGRHPALLGAIIQPTRRTPTMGGVGSTYLRRGEQIGLRFCNILLDLRGSITRSWNSIGLTLTKGMYPTTCDSLAEAPICVTGGGSEICSSASSSLKQKMQTYDLAYSGPRNRFTIRTTEGPIVVHNCGYGVGHVKLQLFLKTQAGVDVTLDEAKRIVDTYRATYPKIPAFWRKCEAALKSMSMGMDMVVDAPGLITSVAAGGFTLPNGLTIQYPDLKRIVMRDKKTDEDKTQWRYITKGLPVHVYGGKAVENICQAVARIVIGEQMLRIAKRYKVVLTVHDSCAIIAPAADREIAQAEIERCMSWRPKWALSLPLACESSWGESYGG